MVVKIEVAAPIFETKVIVAAAFNQVNTVHTINQPLVTTSFVLPIGKIKNIS